MALGANALQVWAVQAARRKRQAEPISVVSRCCTLPSSSDEVLSPGSIEPNGRANPPRVADEAGHVDTLHDVYAHTRGVNDINRLICHSGVDRATDGYERQVNPVRAYDCGLLGMIG